MGNVLFKRENDLGKSKPKQTKFQDLPHIDVLDNRGISNDTQELNTKTLDELGIPPSPPSSLSKKKNKKKNKDSFLKPINSALHETAQASLPYDYEKRIKEFNFEADPEIVKAMENNAKEEIRTINSTKNIVKKTILKDVSKKAITKVERLESKIKSMVQRQKEFEQNVKETIKNMKQDMKELVKENNHILGENTAIIEENKLLSAEIKRLTKHNEAMISVQERNVAFVDSFKEELDPQVEQIKALILQNKSIAKEALVIHKQFKQLKILFEQQNSISKNHAHHIKKIQDDLKTLTTIIHELKQEGVALKLIKTKDSFDKKTMILSEKLNELTSSVNKYASEISKTKLKVEILRDRFNAFRTHKKK